MNYDMDMFEQILPKKEQLRVWLKRNRFIPTHEVIAWGLHNRHIRADRDARDMADENKGEVCLRRLTENEQRFYGFKCKDGVWAWVEK